MKIMLFLPVFLLFLSACQPSASVPPPSSHLPTMTTFSSPSPESNTAQPPEHKAVTYADVLFVSARQESDGTWTFSVTVQHEDTGWEHYADGWDVLLPDGSIVKPDPSSPFTRLLLHPHVDEQPFTRSQRGIVIPPGVSQVIVRAHDLLHGYGGRTVAVDLTRSSGENYEVEHNR